MMEYHQRRTNPQGKRGRNSTSEEWEAGSHITAITRRYDGIPMPDGVMYRQGNDQVYVHNTPIQRASRNTEEPPIFRTKPRRPFHSLVFLGILFFLIFFRYLCPHTFYHLL